MRSFFESIVMRKADEGLCIVKWDKNYHLPYAISDTELYRDVINAENTQRQVIKYLVVLKGKVF